MTFHQLKQIALNIYLVGLVGAIGSFFLYGFMVSDMTEMVFDCDAYSRCAE